MLMSEDPHDQRSDPSTSRRIRQRNPAERHGGSTPIEAGDRVLAVETDRGILLTPYAPETERALKIAAKAAKKYRNALRELAK